ncbi:MAG: proton-conducting transporter membrane subunit [Verrucomicrobiota bacterium]
MKTLLLLALALPGVLFMASGLAWLAGLKAPEPLVSRLTKASYLFSFLVFSAEAFRLLFLHDPSLDLRLGDWFATAHTHFGVELLFDRLSVPLLWLASLLVGVVAAFSGRYMHKDPGFHRYFNLLNLFGFGAFLVAAAGSVELLMAGWELVGITSVLLIGFFQERPEPVGNALRVYGYYRVADIFLVASVMLGHLWFGGIEFAHLHLPDAAASGSWKVTATALLLIMAACGKSSVGPFFGWLPRAMEGPTPSSAIFYGAVSVHLGAFLLLRAEPLLRASGTAAAALVALGGASALMGTLLHRSANDAKTMLAHATQTQLGLIFVEIGMGWTGVAAFHITGHAIVRTAQFLRAPSLLHEHLHVHAAAGGELAPTGEHLEALVPRRAQWWLYRVAMGAGFYEAVVSRALVAPLARLTDGLALLEPAPAKPRPSAPLDASPAEETQR